MGRIGGFFSHEPALLFAVGNRGLLGDGEYNAACEPYLQQLCEMPKTAPNLDELARFAKKGT